MLLKCTPAQPFRRPMQHLKGRRIRSLSGVSIQRIKAWLSSKYNITGCGKLSSVKKGIHVKNNVFFVLWTHFQHRIRHFLRQDATAVTPDPRFPPSNQDTGPARMPRLPEVDDEESTVRVFMALTAIRWAFRRDHPAVEYFFIFFSTGSLNFMLGSDKVYPYMFKRFESISKKAGQSKKNSNENF